MSNKASKDDYGIQFRHISHIRWSTDSPRHELDGDRRMLPYSVMSLRIMFPFSMSFSAGCFTLLYAGSDTAGVYLEDNTGESLNLDV